MNKTQFGVLFITLIIFFGLALVVNAQETEEVAGGNEDIIIGEWDLVAPLEGIEIDQPQEIPSRWGLFWRGIKERVAIAATFDPVKKATKRIKFAEERMHLAELISAKAVNPKVQARAEKMVDRANKLMAKVETSKEKWLQRSGAQVNRLIKNVASHQIRKEAIMDRLEEKLPEEKLERLREMREKSLDSSQRLLNAISNENLPEDIKEHLETIRTRIAEHVAEVKEFRVRQRELLQDVKGGDASAREELKDLRRDRLETVKARTIEVKAIKQLRQIKVQSGDNAIQNNDRKVLPPKTKVLPKVDARPELKTRIENKIGNTQTKKELCQTRGGEWSFWRDTPDAVPECNLPTSDGGKKCISSSQCESYCQTPKGTTIGVKVVGECYKFKIAICMQEVKNGVADAEWCY